ncbi:unnamed protein product, partial [Allacma fusca]
MYRQILVHPDDTPYQRIIWRESPENPELDFELLTVTYGTASAPYLATRTLKQLAEDERADHPIGSQVLVNDFYVDDLLSGARTADEAINLKLELTRLLNRGDLTYVNGHPMIRIGNFELHGFCDSSESAYAAVVYVRTLGSNPRVTIMAAKSKVAPIKQ